MNHAVGGILRRFIGCLAPAYILIAVHLENQKRNTSAEISAAKRGMSVSRAREHGRGGKVDICGLTSLVLK